MASFLYYLEVCHLGESTIGQLENVVSGSWRRKAKWGKILYNKTMVERWAMHFILLAFSFFQPSLSSPLSFLPLLLRWDARSRLNLCLRPDIDWTRCWPLHIPCVQSKNGLLTHLYPLMTNRKSLWAANRKMSAFFFSSGRKWVSLKSCWETFSSFPSFPISLPWQTVIN